MPSRHHLLSERFGPRRPCVVVNPSGGAAAPRASWLQPSGENNFPAAARLPRAANSFRLGAYAGTKVKVDGEELLVMKESDILAVLEG